MTDIRRRAFVEAAGVMALAPLGGAAQTAARSADESANVRIVSEFCAAWATRDLQKILPFLAEDNVYRMTETTPPALGHAGVRERLGSWRETSQQIEFRIKEWSDYTIRVERHPA